jgi:hypothetical protein
MMNIGLILIMNLLIYIHADKMMGPVYTSSEADTCVAPDKMMGHVCSSSKFVNGSRDTTVSYRVTDILYKTRIECYGLGTSYNARCDNINFDWKYLGFFEIDDEVEIYWGDIPAYPMIKCQGYPLYTPFSWTWTESTTNNTICSRKTKCCGNDCYDPINQICCDCSYICPSGMDCCNGKCCPMGCA